MMPTFNRFRFLFGEPRPTTTDTTMNSETANRTRKALAIADVLRRSGIDHDASTYMSDQDWQQAARIAAQMNGTRWTDASDKTRDATRAALQHNEADDPFEGFPP